MLPGAGDQAGDPGDTVSSLVNTLETHLSLVQVAQSSDGTCYNNLASSQSGHRTLKLDKVRLNRSYEVKISRRLFYGAFGTATWLTSHRLSRDFNTQFKLLPDYHRNKTYDTFMKQVEDKTEDEEQEESCEFPGWARDMGPLISFSFSSR